MKIQLNFRINNYVLCMYFHMNISQNSLCIISTVWNTSLSFKVREDGIIYLGENNEPRIHSTN